MALSDASTSLIKSLQRNEQTIDGALAYVWDERGWRGFSGLAQTFILHFVMGLLTNFAALGGGIAFGVGSFRGTAAAVFFSLIGAAFALSSIGVYTTLVVWMWRTGLRKQDPPSPDEFEAVMRARKKRNERVFVFSAALLVLDLGLFIAAIIVAIVDAALKG